MRLQRERKNGFVKASSFATRMNRKNVVHKNQKTKKKVTAWLEDKDNRTWGLGHRETISTLRNSSLMLSGGKYPHGNIS